MINSILAAVLLLSQVQAADLPGNFTLNKTGDNLCFAAKFDLVLNVEYLKLDGKKNTSRIPLTNETFSYYNGSCFADKSHVLNIYMFDSLTSITFNFILNEKNQSSLSSVQASINVEKDSPYFVNHTRDVETVIVFTANESLFSTDRAYSYRCNSRTKIDNFRTDKNLTIKSIDLENLRVQPFVNESIPFHDYATGS